MADQTKEQKLTPEQTQAIAEATQTPQTSPTNMNRRQRRGMMKQQGVLKYLSGQDFLGEIRGGFRAQNIENGRTLHQRNVDANDKANGALLEEKLNSIKATWKETGYTDSEILKLEEAWALSTIKDKENRKADKKTIKKLQREVKESFLSRKQ
jgi:thiamine kinase-like enzyme